MINNEEDKKYREAAKRSFSKSVEQEIRKYETHKCSN